MCEWGTRGHCGAVMLSLQRDVSADVCPMCHAELGRPRGATRRQIVLTAVPGTFRWRCPDCAGVWQVVTGGSPAATSADPAPAAAGRS